MQQQDYNQVIYDGSRDSNAKDVWMANRGSILTVLGSYRWYVAATTHLL